MVTSRLLYVGATIPGLLPEFASHGDWRLLPYCKYTDELGGPSPLVVIARCSVGLPPGSMTSR